MSRWARFSSRSPRALGCCDRCSFVYAHSDLRLQMKYAGTGLVSTGWLVCPTCLDIPNPQGRAAVLHADEVPVRNPRPDPTEGVIGNPLMTETGAPLFTESGTAIKTENGG